MDTTPDPTIDSPRGRLTAASARITAANDQLTGALIATGRIVSCRDEVDTLRADMQSGVDAMATLGPDTFAAPARTAYTKALAEVSRAAAALTAAARLLIEETV